MDWDKCYVARHFWEDPHVTYAAWAPPDDETVEAHFKGGYNLYMYRDEEEREFFTNSLQLANILATHNYTVSASFKNPEELNMMMKQWQYNSTNATRLVEMLDNEWCMEGIKKKIIEIYTVKYDLATQAVKREALKLLQGFKEQKDSKTVDEWIEEQQQKYENFKIGTPGGFFEDKAETEFDNGEGKA